MLTREKKIAESMYENVLAFHDQSEPFALGFEAGKLYERLISNEDEEITEVVHQKSTESFLRMAEHQCRHVEAKLLDDTWMELYFGAVGTG